MGKERKSLGIKFKRCVQVVRSAYQTPGMKRIVMFVFLRVFSFTLKCLLGIYLNFRLILRLYIKKAYGYFSFQSPGFWDPCQFVHLIYCDRMRTVQDKQKVRFFCYISFQTKNCNFGIKPTRLSARPR